MLAIDLSHGRIRSTLHQVIESQQQEAAGGPIRVKGVGISTGTLCKQREPLRSVRLWQLVEKVSNVTYQLQLSLLFLRLCILVARKKPLLPMRALFHPVSSSRFQREFCGDR